MTEELEKEAGESSFRYTLDKPWACEVERKQIMAHFQKGYLAGAEPREKRIAELEDKLANADYQLEGRDLEIKELEAQIEKMKTLLSQWLQTSQASGCGNINIVSDTEKLLKETE